MKRTELRRFLSALPTQELISNVLGDYQIPTNARWPPRCSRVDDQGGTISAINSGGEALYAPPRARMTAKLALRPGGP